MMERCMPASCSYSCQGHTLESSASRSSRRHCQAVRCSSSRRFNPPGRDSLSGEGQLILPGQNNRGQQDRPSKLIMPGSNDSGSGKGAPGRGNLLGLEPSSAPPPTINTFRPPPGFMDEDKPRDAAAMVSEVPDPQVALNRIRAGAGHWHELARLLPGLAVAGYDATIVDAETGVERRTQSRWAVSLQVYDSLAKEGSGFPPQKLAYFDVEGGEDLLHEMRFLAVAARPASAEYIVDGGLDAVEATVLARSVKEHERRAGQKEGFSAHPGDCLAYKHYRDAQECRKDAAKEACAARGMTVAVTDSARKKLRSLVEAEPEEAREAAAAKLAIFKLTAEEAAFKPVPLLPGLAELSPADLAEVPAARQSGPFNAFTPPAEGRPGQQWVGLPAWNLLLLARRPYAVPLRNCADVPAVLAAAKAKTEDEKRRAGGPGLLLVDRIVKEVAEEHYYLVPAAAGNGKGLALVEGNKVAGGADSTLGQVLFLCRPPVLGARSPATETSELLQL